MTDKPSGLFAITNFRWHLAGTSVNVIGDQFTILALPWLVLRMTGDPLMIGVVLAFSATPRLLLMLVGGAAVDRFRPKRILLAGRCINAALLGLLAWCVYSGQINVPVVCVFSALIGLSSAFYFPAAQAMLPQILPPLHLPVANSVVNGIRQSATAIAPLLAGLVIATLGDGGQGLHGSANGLAVAFLIDGLTFAISAVTLSQIRLVQTSHPPSTKKPPRMIDLLVEGVRYCFSQTKLRTILLYVTIGSMFVSGPVTLAIPVLTAKISNSAMGLGFLAGAFGVGTILGVTLSGARPAWATRLGALMLVSDLFIGICLLLASQISQIWEATAIFGIIGVWSGFLQSPVLSWIQMNVQPAMIGRVMSVFLMVNVGVAPLSGVVAGWIMRMADVNSLFLGAGLSLLAIVLVAWAITPMRRISLPQPALAGK